MEQSPKKDLDYLKNICSSFNLSHVVTTECPTCSSLFFSLISNLFSDKQSFEIKQVVILVLDLYESLFAKVSKCNFAHGNSLFCYLCYLEIYDMIKTFYYHVGLPTGRCFEENVASIYDSFTTLVNACENCRHLVK